MIQLYADFDVLELSDASIDKNARLISHAATGWRTQGTGFGYSAGVTGRRNLTKSMVRYTNWQD